MKKIKKVSLRLGQSVLSFGCPCGTCVYFYTCNCGTESTSGTRKISGNHTLNRNAGGSIVGGGG